MRLAEITISCFILMALFLFGCKQSNIEPEPVDPDPADTMEMIRPDTIFNVNTGTTLDEAFWDEIRSALDTGHVMVRFAVGEYTLTSPIVVENLGHDEHLLMLQAESTNRVIFDGEIPTLMTLENCHHIRVRGFRFTGNPTAYAMKVTNSQQITIENSYFQNLPNAANGALGIHQPETDRILVRNCRFEFVGVDANSHMIEAANGVTRLTIVNSYFKDCAGSFVCFRGDLSDMGVLYLNDFISTGTYLTGINPAFIEVPAFNETDPGDERMGTNFMIVDNTFSYGNMGNQTDLYALVFHTSGFSPSDRDYQLSATDGEKLQEGSAAEKQAIMSSQLGLDGDKIQFGENFNRNVEYSVVYRHSENEGSSSPWTGIADIESAINTTGLVASEEEAIGYYP